MKKIQILILTIMTSTTLLTAGGDILKVTPYEIKDDINTKVVPLTTNKKEETEVMSIKVPEVDISTVYVGLGLVTARYDSRCSGTITQCHGTDKSAGFLIRAGYDFSEYMGMEARGLITPFKTNGGEIRHMGAFAKPMYPVGDALSFYGLAGVAKTTTHGTMPNVNANGLALGAGVSYDFSNQKETKSKGFGVFADYERLYQKSNVPKLDALSVGLSYEF